MGVAQKFPPLVGGKTVTRIPGNGNIREDCKAGPVEGTASHARATVALDKAGRGHFILDTVRVRGTALREGQAHACVVWEPPQRELVSGRFSASGSDGALSVSCTVTVLSHPRALRGAGQNVCQCFGAGRKRQDPGAMVGWEGLATRAGSRECPDHLKIQNPVSPLTAEVETGALATSCLD